MGAHEMSRGGVLFQIGQIGREDLGGFQIKGGEVRGGSYFLGKVWRAGETERGKRLSTETGLESGVRPLWK